MKNENKAESKIPQEDLGGAYWNVFKEAHYRPIKESLVREDILKMLVVSAMGDGMRKEKERMKKKFAELRKEIIVFDNVKIIEWNKVKEAFE